MTILLTSPIWSASAETLSGTPYIEDADTVRIAGINIRLAGIDAPEVHPLQICLDGNGAYSKCGVAARDALVIFAAGREWRCELQAKARTYGRRVGSCFVGGVDVQHWLVRAGWALDYPKYSNGAFAADQESARVAKRGLWAGSFIEPWNWRHRTCKTTILGAYVVPIDAKDKLCRPEPKRSRRRQ